LRLDANGNRDQQPPFRVEDAEDAKDCFDTHLRRERERMPGI
jgi:hypothetical protein